MSSIEDRRRARQAWPIRRVALEEEGKPDDRDTTTVDERLALVWRLTVEQWAIAGRPIPDYPRAAMPGRMIRPR